MGKAAAGFGGSLAPCTTLPDIVALDELCEDEAVARTPSAPIGSGGVTLSDSGGPRSVPVNTEKEINMHSPVE